MRRPSAILGIVGAIALIAIGCNSPFDATDSVASIGPGEFRPSSHGISSSESVVTANATSTGNKEYNNNRLRSIAEPVSLEAGDVRIVPFNGFDFFTVEHGLGNGETGYTDYLWCEPVRRGGASDCTVADPGEPFDTLYLGISAPPNQEQIEHKGQVSVYYDTPEGWKSIIAQFNGQGQLLHVNGVEPE